MKTADKSKQICLLDNLPASKSELVIITYDWLSVGIVNLNLEYRINQLKKIEIRFIYRM